MLVVPMPSKTKLFFSFSFSFYFFWYSSLCVSSERSLTAALMWYEKAVKAGDEDPDCLPSAGPDTNYR